MKSERMSEQCTREEGGACRVEWVEWVETSVWVICDRLRAARENGKVYKRVVRAAVMLFIPRSSLSDYN